MIELTRVIKDGGPLTKRISLVAATGARNRMAPLV